jgi:hypothetical protein
MNFSSQYVKVCNSGALQGEKDCPANPKLGNKPTNWGCTQDKKTGLMWEIKTMDGGLRDLAKTYSNYTPDYPKCEDEFLGETGVCTNLGFTSKYGDGTNTDGFITAVNKQSLCGKRDWRLPTRDELNGLSYCSNSKYNKRAEGDYDFICVSNENGVTTTKPIINSTYFPGIKDNWFWSSSPYAEGRLRAWSVIFNDGQASSVGSGGRNLKYNVQLVR